jgi:hypothetical protein
MELPTPSGTVILKELPDGAVLYCTRTEVYFGLNPVGVAIWEALPPSSESLDALVHQVVGRFPDADPQTVRADAIEFMEALRQNGLVTPREDTPLQG